MLRTLQAGREKGLDVTTRDLQRLRTLGRWYCLSADHLVRSEYPPERWHPDLADLDDTHVRRRLATDRQVVTNRLRLLAHARPHPLVGTGITLSGLGGWWATATGARLAGLPWRNLATPNPLFSIHAWSAADIGMDLERRGARVLSQREIDLAEALDDVPVPPRVASTYRTSGAREVGKRPDLVVLAPDDERFIAVEVERDTDRALSNYTQKLAAYRDNPDLVAVWYLCATAATARRVRRAAAATPGLEVSGKLVYPLRITVTETRGGYVDVPALDRLTAMTEDLAACGVQV